MNNNINFMITSKKLNSLMTKNENIILIDVREIDEYVNGHIINAVNIPEIFTYLPEGLTTDIEKEDFLNFYKDIFSKAGVGSNDTVVFYEDKFTLMSPRGLAILKYLGHDEEKIKVLDGGYYSWCQNNFETTVKFEVNKPKDFIINIDEKFFVDFNEMMELIHDDSIVKLDVRDKDEWIGISSSPYGINFAPKKGRIPNAVWIEWYEFITHDMLSVTSLDKIQIELDKKAIKEDDNIVLYCFKGARLANSYIALRKLGYKNIRIYFAGWNEWCRKENAPIINEVENSDNPILQENIILKNKLDELNLKQTNLIDFPKYNKQPIFAFTREGEVCSANEAKRKQLPHINRVSDIISSFKSKEIYNMIDNNQEKVVTITINNRYYSIHLRGSRDSNKILAYSFDTTQINSLNNSLDMKIQELERSEEISGLLFEVAPLFIDSFDKDGKCIIWNKECEKVFGWTIEEINKCSNPLELFYPEVETRKKVLDTILNEPEKIFRKWYPLNKKGEKLITMWTHLYLPNGETINIGYDITKNTQNEKLLFEQSKMIAMGEMIANIAHQWRQPLSVISTISTGIKLQKELNILNDDDLITSMNTINDSSQYLSKTIEDFRSFFDPRNTKLTKFLLSDLLNKTLNLISSQFTNKDIEIIQYLSDCEVLSLENELIQVLINILNNARDVLCKEESQRRLIFININKKDNLLNIEIKDNGRGIDENIIDRIFEPYFTTKHQSQGTGIGLYMSEEIIRTHLNGNIIVSNESYTYENIDYIGAKFTIKINL